MDSRLDNFWSCPQHARDLGPRQSGEIGQLNGFPLISGQRLE
jgi:hypothetical protein